MGNLRRSESRFKTRVVPWGSNLLWEENFATASAGAVSVNPFEDTPTPPPVGRWNSANKSIQEEQHMTSGASDQIYCFKCRSKTDTLEAQEVVLKNGRPAVTGPCTVCGTKKFRMGVARK